MLSAALRGSDREEGTAELRRVQTLIRTTVFETLPPLQTRGAKDWFDHPSHHDRLEALLRARAETKDTVRRLTVEAHTDQTRRRALRQAKESHRVAKAACAAGIKAAKKAWIARLASQVNAEGEFDISLRHTKEAWQVLKACVAGTSTVKRSKRCISWTLSRTNCVILRNAQRKYSRST